MTIALITSVEANGGTTAGVDTTGANLLVATCSAFTTLGALSDSNGNTWTSLTLRSGGGARIRLRYVLSPVVGAGHTFTLALGGSGGDYLAVAAYSGVASFDQESGSGTATPGSLTPPADNALLVTGVGTFLGTGYTASGGFTVRQTNDAKGGLADLIQMVAAPANPTWSGPSGDTASAMASFLAAVVVGGGRTGLFSGGSLRHDGILSGGVL